ncbi:NAD(P)H-hydrate dehydratase [Pontibaca methylaminivorans]|uniref:Bifunctional NAD(P)H-hydrate repair enzyme n=1 Tax=Pontibaca methylaminivorans TaxID=515897 RepID=A0A1R3X325_9RHOB|nr:NAD(P)H-hydrate dehydratase [Pontibaca methylaminivorans]SIT84937.1 yjeF C-terminal region, hydroxyethylthiazole kinase-related/yjeF N-terminal region [Pontibaca methylaminivorans]
MQPFLTAAQMRSIESAAMESGRVRELALMECAGQAVADSILAQWPDVAGPESDGLRRPVMVLCGPGNNGGDGFVAARLLAAHGSRVEVFLLGQPDALPPSARRNCERWQGIGPLRPLAEAAGMAQATNDTVVVDALFGTGLSRPLSGVARDLFGRLAALRHRDNGPRLVAVDILSGLCSDSGRVLGDDTGPELPAADLTVTFEAARLGHVLSAGAGLSGRLVVAPIGLAPELAALAAGGGLAEAARPDPSALAKDPGAHKYDHGHALILSGGAGRSGAARLAARGALRIGAGLVTLGAPPDALPEIAAQITALMLRRINGRGDLVRMLADRRVNALCLGPGLGVGRARELVPAALAAGRALVLDADALTAFADAPQELFARLHPRCVLTPHGGEFARLFPDIAARLQAPALEGPAFSRADAVRAAAAEAGCVVLLKGRDTLIATPRGQVRVNAATGARAAPWLATAGAGDVLAGFLTGLLARGLEPLAAAETAAWLHLEAARDFGAGLVAEDIPEALPDVLRRF